MTALRGAMSSIDFNIQTGQSPWFFLLDFHFLPKPHLNALNGVFRLKILYIETDICGITTLFYYIIYNTNRGFEMV